MNVWTCAATVLLSVSSVSSQDLEIITIEKNGELTWTNPAPGIVYRVEWASSPAGPWSASWDDLLDIVSSNATITVAVPMLYRVRADPPQGMVEIPAGTFTMGDTYAVGDSDERPVHDVYVSGFYIDRTEVTNAEMADMMQWAYDRGLITASTSKVRTSEGSQEELLDLDDSECQVNFTGSGFTVDAGKEDFPCVEVSWYGAQAYCNYRSDRVGLPRCIDFADWSCDFTGNGYRLPTEAEWEKAARGGQSGHYYPWPSHGGSYDDQIDGSKANYWGSGDPYESDPDPRTTPVGYYAAWGYGDGLYDMAGNVREWCWDWYDGNWYGNTAADNPDTAGPAGPLSNRVLRSGSWNGHPADLRCARRDSKTPSDTSYHNGFRSVRGL